MERIRNTNRLTQHSGESHADPIRRKIVARQKFAPFIRAVFSVSAALQGLAEALRGALTKFLCRLGLLVSADPMGWGSPTCLSHLLRDGLTLEITCPCGHVARPDILALRAAMWLRAGGEELKDLRSVMRCSDCGEQRFSYRLIPAAEATA